MSSNSKYHNLVRECVKSTNILLPNKNIDFKNWPVIACDQYTSEPKYWDKVKIRASNIPCAYHIVLPELYLEQSGDISVESRVETINKTMNRYLDEKILEPIGESFVLIDRQTPIVQSRKGLLISIDLEKYDFNPNSTNLIRATEGTVLERIPPRMQIRKDASLEIPHIQLLVDDPKRSIIEPLFRAATKGEFDILYDVDLPEGGGHIKGFKIPANSYFANEALEAMACLDSINNFGLLFAVGDGNHSLATAKSHWDKIKNNVKSDHPARYALVELINIYDGGIIFEPIHRVLFDTKFDEFISKAKLFPNAKVEVSAKMSIDNAILMAKTISPEEISVPIFSKNEAVVFSFMNFEGQFHADATQQLIDWYMDENPKARVDYIHGEDSVKSLSNKNIGILLPSILKSTFFETIASQGVFPRKTFSIGEAYEKRYYIEAKLIK